MIVTGERIFEPMRSTIKNAWFKQLVECYYCLSVWVGFVMASLYLFSQYSLAAERLLWFISLSFSLSALTVLINRQEWSH